MFEPLLTQRVHDSIPSPSPAPPVVARWLNNEISLLMLQKSAAQGACVFCEDALATHISTPCGHLRGCAKCLDLLSKSPKECLLCSAHFTGLVHVFVAEETW